MMRDEIIQEPGYPPILKSGLAHAVRKVEAGMKSERDMLEVATEEPPMVTGFEMATPVLTVIPDGNGLSVYNPPHSPATAENESPFERVMRLASDPNFDVEKLDRLVAMIREQERDKQRQAFNAAMIACQKAIPPIKVNKKNPDTNSMYASLDAVSKVLTPIYTAHGFFVSFGMDESKLEGHYGVTALIAHEGGFERRERSDFPADDKGKQGTRNKTPIHGYASTLSYAQRYLLKLIFNLSVEGEDKDGNQPGDTITEQQYTELRQKIEAWDVDEEKLLAFLKIEELPLLPAKRFDAIMRDLKADAKKRGFQI